MTTETMTVESRLNRLDQMLVEDRVIRGAWKDTAADGRERACLLVAMYPEVTDSASQCSVGWLPRWFAGLVPSIDDNGTEEKWPAMVKRFAATIRLTSSFGENDWNEVLRLFLLAVVESVLPYCDEETLPAVTRVLGLLRRTDTVWPAEWAAADAAVWAAADAAADAAVWSAARAAVWDANADALLSAIETVSQRNTQ